MSTDATEATVTLATQSEQQQFDVLHRSLEIFKERENTRGSLWAQFGTADAMDWVEKKKIRIEHAINNLPQAEGTGRGDAIQDELVDDLLDLINYAAFVVRHVEGNKPDVAAD